MSFVCFVVSALGSFAEEVAAFSHGAGPEPGMVLPGQMPLSNYRPPRLLAPSPEEQERYWAKLRERQPRQEPPDEPLDD